MLTLREDELDKVSRYIDNQEEHHRSGRVSKLLECVEDNADAAGPSRGEPSKGFPLVSGPRRERVGYGKIALTGPRDMQAIFDDLAE